MQFVAPTVCLMSGLGATAMVRALPCRSLRPVVLGTILGLLALLAVRVVAHDLRSPYLFLADWEDREFAKRFWPAQSREAEMACLFTDFGLFNRRALGPRTAIYSCYQAIYRPHRRPPEQTQRPPITADHPLRCVLYPATRPESRALSKWQDLMNGGFELRRTTRVGIGASGGRTTPSSRYLIVYEFVPKPVPTATRPQPARVRR
jgi:hypothetical protein